VEITHNNFQKTNDRNTTILTPTTRIHLLIITLRKVSSVSSLLLFLFFSVSKFTLQPRYYPNTTSKREVNSIKEAPKGRDLVNRFTRNTMVHWLRSVFRFCLLLTQFYTSNGPRVVCGTLINLGSHFWFTPRT
jgi:hypothetical protein